MHVHFLHEAQNREPLLCGALMPFNQSKHHTGKCSMVFDKWMAGKCNKCGYHKKWRMRCAFPICNKTITGGHVCGIDPMTTMYGR